VKFTRALRKTEFSEFFIFASFGISSIPNFAKITKTWRQNWIFGISRKKYGIFETPVFGSKHPVLGAKTGILGSKTGVSEYSVFVLFQIFHIFAKNSFWLKFRLEYSSLSLVCRALKLSNFLSSYVGKINYIKQSLCCLRWRVLP